MDCGCLIGICYGDMGAETDVSLVFRQDSLSDASFIGVRRDVLPW